MNLDLIRLWKDPDYAGRLGESKNIEPNPAGTITSDEVLKTVAGGAVSTVNLGCGTTSYANSTICGCTTLQALCRST